jgi:GNAT superfamily N-acetyltransferase
MTPSLEIAVAKPDEAAAFWRANDRAWRSEAWAFKVVWHEQSHDIAATVDGAVAGGLNVRIAASLAHVEALFVLPEHRGNGIGRALLVRCEELANYYNCHKVSAAVMNGSGAARFYEACGYHVEAILPQHTFKLDVAMLRKFLL